MDDKRYIRELKRNVKRVGNRKRRRFLKDVNAELDSFEFGSAESSALNRLGSKSKGGSNKKQAARTPASTGPIISQVTEQELVMAKKQVNESKTNQLDISGFGDNVITLTDKETHEIIAYIGVLAGVEKVHFTKPLTPDQVEAVHDLLQTKKFTRHISKERFGKAQDYADRKF